MPLTEFGERIEHGDIGELPTQQRIMRVYSRDPLLSKADGNIGELTIPFELLTNGVGRRLALRRLQPQAWPMRLTRNRRAIQPFPDFGSAASLLNGGIDPSTSNPLFGQQMAYAVASPNFSSSLIEIAG